MFNQYTALKDTWTVRSNWTLLKKTVIFSRLITYAIQKYLSLKQWQSKCDLKIVPFLIAHSFFGYIGEEQLPYYYISHKYCPST